MTDIQLYDGIKIRYDDYVKMAGDQCKLKIRSSTPKKDNLKTQQAELSDFDDCESVGLTSVDSDSPIQLSYFKAK